MKQFIIIVLLIMLGTLLIQNPSNLTLLKRDAVVVTDKTLDLSLDTIGYLAKKYDQVTAPKEFEVENTLDIPTLNLQKEPMIREETFFDEK